jgi:hypothetical protein
MKKIFQTLAQLFSNKRGTLLLIWLGWALVMIGYQAYVVGRFELQIKDRSLWWTEYIVNPGYQRSLSSYLTQPYLNEHLAWDSEYYISIAVGGYHDPIMRSIPPDYSRPDNAQMVPQKSKPDWISMNYAFFPLYPCTSRILAYLLKTSGVNPMAAVPLSGVLVSMLGTLGAMFALYFMARENEGDLDGLRAAYYLVIFPAGMFLAQVYTEGFFVGLSFGALALAQKKNWLLAGLLAACATWTRAAGGLLVVPLALYWLKDGGLTRLFTPAWWKEAVNLFLVSAPVWAFLAFELTLGSNFHLIESIYFDRGLLLLNESWIQWKDAFLRMISDNLQARTYFIVEFGAIFLGVLACFWMFRREPILTVYSLLIIFFSMTTGVAQGMHRYVIAAPVIFLLLARWGKSEAFDRVWTLASSLLMGVFAILFSFNLWAG